MSLIDFIGTEGTKDTEVRPMDIETVRRMWQALTSRPKPWVVPIPPPRSSTPPDVQ